MKKIPVPVIVYKPRFEHGDVIEFTRPLGHGVIGEVGVVAKSGPDTLTAYLVATKRFAEVRHDDPAIRFVGHVTKTAFAPA